MSVSRVWLHETSRVWLHKTTLVQIYYTVFAVNVCVCGISISYAACMNTILESLNATHWFGDHFFPFYPLQSFVSHRVRMAESVLDQMCVRVLPAGLDQTAAKPLVSVYCAPP